MAHDKNKEGIAHGGGAGSILTPVEEYFTDDNNHAPSPIKTITNEGGTSNLDHAPNLEAIEEVLKTFSPSVVHKAYVDFCKLIGQISLTNHLRNIDIIEELHATYSKQGQVNPEDLSVTLLGLSTRLGSSGGGERGGGGEGEDSSSDDSDSCSSDTSCESNLDISYQLGPSVALQGKT